MSARGGRGRRRPGGSRRGFAGGGGYTLVEAAIATAIIALVISAVAYGLGMSASAVRSECTQYQRTALLASKLNQLDTVPFAELAAGADTLTAGGETFVRGWTVARYDGDGDGSVDAGLLLITVWVDTDTCQTLRCDLR